MKISIFLFFLFQISYVKANCTHDKTSFRCVEYVRNYDADTITFNIPSTHPLLGEKINIRVLGVDTPEIRTKNKCEKAKAKASKDIVADKLKKAKRIDLLNVSRGKYFRIVADVIIDGESLSKYLLSQGHAYAYDGGKKKNMNWCKPAREIASDNKLK